MTPPKKPDWMEIADGDNQEPAIVAKKRRPIAIAMTALLVTLGGVVVAQTHEESPASADEMIIPQSSQSATTASQAINPAAPSQSPRQSASKSAKQSAPAIATPPAMTGGDDDERGEHEGRRDHERGEHDDRDGDFEEH